MDGTSRREEETTEVTEDRRESGVTQRSSGSGRGGEERVTRERWAGSGPMDRERKRKKRINPYTWAPHVRGVTED